MDTSPRTETDIEMPFALLAGRLEGISLPDLLWALCRNRVTGVLRVEHGTVEKSLYFEDGRIVFAGSNDPDDRLGELLLRRGLITLDQLDEGLTRLHTGNRLGTLLVEAGSLTPDQLVDGVLSQVESVVLDLFLVEQGDYRFELGPLPTDEVIKLGINTGELLMRGIRRIRSFQRIRRSVGPPHQGYALSADADGLMEGLDLASAAGLVERLRRGPASLEGLCREVFLSNFELYQTMWGLRVLGIVEPYEPAHVTIGDLAHEGSLADVDFAELLVRLGRSGETGVLHVTREAQERTFHISGGRCVFATSNDPDDGLLAHLLRRGVISLRDREETAKKLLSNKRVGTILRELGVIDEHDLKQAVREQLSEIVYDTFRWTDAHYTFLAGMLPSVEDITLEEDLDRLVAQGLRRVASWRRVWRGCGGLDTPMRLRPSYLAVLDAMDAGPDEWQVIAALRTPKTPRRICRESYMSDFRVCQILWTMRLLGALEPAAEVPAIAGAEAAVPPVDRDRVEPDDHAPEPVTAEAEPVAADAAPETPEEEPEEAEAADSVPVDDALAAGASESAEVEPVFEPAADSDARAAAEERYGIDFDETRDDAEADVAAEVEPAEAEGAIDRGAGAPRYDEPSGESEPEWLDTVSDEDVAASEPEREPEAAFAAAPSEPERWGDAAAFDAAPVDDGESAVEPSAPEEIETGSVGEFRPDATQAIPAHEVRAALDGPGIDATQVIPREVLESALGAAPAEAAGANGDGEPDEGRTLRIERSEADDAVADEMPAEPWEPPPGLDGAIARFNAMQRVVYRAVRMEVGAGAPNFVRSCSSQLATTSADPLAGASMQADGTWDVEGLRQAVVEQRVADPWGEYRKLIDAELDLLRQHVGEARAAELLRQLERLEGAEAHS